MRKYYHLDNKFTIGEEMVSSHLMWLINLAMEKAKADPAVIAFVADSNTIAYGTCFEPAQAIVLNLFHHFESAREVVQKTEEGVFLNKNTSIRFVLLKELLDTAFHEALHLTGLNEEQVKGLANDFVFRLAEEYDIEIASFGPTLDGWINEFREECREDIKDDPHAKEFKKLQLHMLDNQVAFFSPESRTEIKKMRKALELFAENAIGKWRSEMDPSFKLFKPNEPVVEAHAIQQPVQQPTVVMTPAAPVTTTTATPVMVPAITTSETLEYFEDDADPSSYDDLDDYCPLDYEDGSTGGVTQLPTMGAVPPQAATSPAVQPYVAPAINAPAAPIQVQNSASTPVPAAVVNGDQAAKIQQIGNTVMRRLFNHVQSKCIFNTAGGYNNPSAIFEPVTIADIEGAGELFVKQDTVNHLGVFTPNVPVAGSLKGCLSKDGLPQYKFSLFIGGKEYKRTFIVQNPNKMKNGALTRWAQEAREGVRRMLLLGEIGTATIAYVELVPGLPLGQEEVKRFA